MDSIEKNLEAPKEEKQGIEWGLVAILAISVLTLLFMVAKAYVDHH